MQIPCCWFLHPPKGIWSYGFLHTTSIIKISMCSLFFNASFECHLCSISSFIISMLFWKYSQLNSLVKSKNRTKNYHILTCLMQIFCSWLNNALRIERGLMGIRVHYERLKGWSFKASECTHVLNMRDKSQGWLQGAFLRMKEYHLGFVSALCTQGIEEGHRVYCWRLKGWGFMVCSCAQEIQGGHKM